MRNYFFLFFLLSLSAACKSSQESRRSSEANLLVPITEKIGTESDLPACDKVLVGKSYWVQSLNREVVCVEGGVWNPREADPTEKDETSFGPRGLSN